MSSKKMCTGLLRITRCRNFKNSLLHQNLVSAILNTCENNVEAPVRCFSGILPVNKTCFDLVPHLDPLTKFSFLGPRQDFRISKGCQHTSANEEVTGKENGQSDDISKGDEMLLSKNITETMTPSEVLQNLDPTKQKLLKVIKLEYDVLQQMGMHVPEKMTDNMWLKVLDYPTPSSRRKYYRYLRKIENTEKAKKRKKEMKLKILEEDQNNSEEKEHYHKVARNTIFMHIRRPTMNQIAYSRLAHSMMFGTSLVIDLGFEDHMRAQDCTNLAEQLWMSFGFNKGSREPFNFIFANAQSNGKVLRAMQATCVDTPLDKYLFTLTDKCYLDMFPREKLVYLTPNAPDSLTKFNDDDIYIIGGFVDKASAKPVSMAKAKEQNIRMAKFPLDQHLVWTQGTKSLTIDQVIRILLELKDSNDWKKALQFVPQRKVMNLDKMKANVANMERNKYRKKKFRFE